MTNNSSINSTIFLLTYCQTSAFQHRWFVPLSEVNPETGEREYTNPEIADDAFIAPSATLTGAVEVWDKSSVWYDCVIRGDSNLVRIGSCTSIQDGTVIREALGPLDVWHDGSTIVGHNVTIGHRCLLRACTIEDGCLVGMGSILQEGSYMEEGSVLGAGSVLTAGTRVPRGEVCVVYCARSVLSLLTILLLL